MLSIPGLPMKERVVIASADKECHGARMRKGPGGSGFDGVEVHLPNGSILPVIKREDKWITVEHNGGPYHIDAADVKTLAQQDHPNGTVVFVDSPQALESHWKCAIMDVAYYRGVILYPDADAAEKGMQAFSDGSIVCIAAAREPSIRLAKFLREETSQRLLRKVPLLVLTRDQRVRLAAAKCGSWAELDVKRVASRILSLPSRPVIDSEPAAALFKGLMVDADFGPFKEKTAEDKDWVFSENRKYLLQGMHSSRMDWYPRVERYDDHIAEVASFVKGLQPVHRCSPGTFMAILREGGLVSRLELQSLLSKDSSGSAILRRVARHVQLQSLVRNSAFQRWKRAIFQYTEAVCRLKLLTDTRIRINDVVTYNGKRAVVTSGLDEDKLFGIKYDDGAEAFAGLKSLEKRVDLLAVDNARQSVEHARPDMPAADLGTLETVVNAVVEDVLAASEASLTGIGYSKDVELGTNRHVFGTLGLNNGFYYGSVVMILKSSLLYHPDSWFTPLAATGFVGPFFWAFRHRPWSGVGLEKLAQDLDPGDRVYKKLKESPENDKKGVEACIHASVNMAAVENWPTIMAREIDGMCNYLSFGHRDAYSFDDASGEYGMDWTDENVRNEAGKKLLDARKTKVLPNAWQTVVQYYESKNSHTLYECHLPSFIPLCAVEKVLISNHLYKHHSDIKAKVDDFILPDGRRLADIIEITNSKEHCINLQHEHFDARRRRHLAESTNSEGKLEHNKKAHPVPISVCVAGRRGRPVFLPPDFVAWFLSTSSDYDGWVRSRSSSLCISFCCSAWHDIRVFFSSTSEPQRETEDLHDKRWHRTTYQICIGTAHNSVSYITKGILGTKHTLHVEQDPLAKCQSFSDNSLQGGDSKPDCCIGIWERYWFRVQTVKAGKHVSCGRGPVGENVMMELVDEDPINDLKYIGLGCWNEPTTYCDLQAPWISSK